MHLDYVTRLVRIPVRADAVTALPNVNYKAHRSDDTKRARQTVTRVNRFVAASRERAARFICQRRTHVAAGNTVDKIGQGKVAVHCR